MLVCIIVVFLFSCRRNSTDCQPSRAVSPCNYDTTGYRFYEAYQYDSALFYFGKTRLCFQQENLSETDNPRWFGKNYQYTADAWYDAGDFDSALHYYRQAAQLFQGVGDSLKYSENLNSAGICYAIMSNYDSAESVMKRAIAIEEKMDSSSGLADLYQNMGIVCSDQGRIEAAIDYYFKALSLCERTGDSSGYVDMSKCLADLYLNNKDTLMAEKYLNMALSRAKLSTESVSHAGLYCSLGEYAFFKKQYDEALDWFNQLAELSRKTGYKRGLAAAYSNLASYWQVMKNYDLSVSYHRQAIELDKSLDNQYGVVDSQVLLAEVYYESGKYYEAIAVLQEALDITTEHEITDQLPPVYEGMFENLKALRRYDAALQYHELYLAEKEKLSGVEMQEKIRDIEARYENEKALRSIEKLNQQTLFQQQKIRSREYLLWMSAGLLLVIVALFLLMIRQHKLKAKLEQVDMEQRLLRAQLRPHFIFNVLNSLKYYIQTGQNDPALTHLSSFARLMRKTLYQTSQDEVSIQDELDVLHDYLLLESTKFGNELTYAVEVDKEIDAAACSIPPFILQPFVENALIHAFKDKQGDKKIRIAVGLSSFPGVLDITISDNGTGMNAIKKPGHKQSMGGAITARRLTYFNKVNGFTGKAVEVISNEQFGQSSGTVIHLHIARKKPVNHDKNHNH